MNQAERLTAEIAGTSAFPRVERNLKQLAETGQELWSRTSAESRLSRQTAHVSASILLAGRGYDLTKVTQQLESLSSRKQLLDAEGADQRSDDGGAADAAAVATAARDPAVQSFLRSERESAILSAVENVKKKTFDQVDQLFRQSVQQEWEEEKRRILTTTLGTEANAGDDSIFPPASHADQTMRSASSATAAADTPPEEPRKIRDSVMQLMREGKSYDHIVGCIQSDGCRNPGSLDKLRPALDVDALIEEIAGVAEKEAFLEDAVRLYDLAGVHGKALDILNKLLAGVVSSDPCHNTHREKVEQIALTLAERYALLGHCAGNQVSATFFLLLDLMTFFTYYHRQSLHDALNTISKLNVVPLSQQELDTRVQDFKKMSVEIQRNVPDVLIACMNILYAQYRETKVNAMPSVQKFGTHSEFGNREQRLTEIREKARTLITFAGMIPYRMTGETNAKLVQLEVLMN